MKLEIKRTHVTPEEVTNAIASATYVKLGKKVTVCHLTLKNGHEVIGMSACVDPENYKQDIGEQIALKNATEEVWKHMGSILQDRLSEVSSDPKERLKVEFNELVSKYEKLDIFVRSENFKDTFQKENPVQAELLIEQRIAMDTYIYKLNSRLNNWGK